MVASTAPATGRLAVVLPQGALFRMGTEGAIRAKVLELDLVEAVIGLGPSLFYGTGLAACILVARRRKTPDRSGKILLVDGTDLFRRGRNQNTLEPEHVRTLLAAYEEFADQAGRSRVATIEEIRERGHNLNLAGYIAKTDESEVPPLADVTTALREALEAAWAAEDRLNELLAERGIA
jgi:type I restriction enzyme M protein